MVPWAHLSLEYKQHLYCDRQTDRQTTILGLSQ